MAHVVTVPTSCHRRICHRYVTRTWDRDDCSTLCLSPGWALDVQLIPRLLSVISGEQPRALCFDFLTGLVFVFSLRERQLLWAGRYPPLGVPQQVLLFESLLSG